VQDRVAEPEPPARVVDDSLHERLVELVVADRLTVPVKPFRGATLIVELPPTPALTLTLVGLEEMVKSDVWTETETLVEWVTDPLVPVTVTL
jgi:hypothetical protein